MVTRAVIGEIRASNAMKLYVSGGIHFLFFLILSVFPPSNLSKQLLGYTKIKIYTA